MSIKRLYKSRKDKMLCGVCGGVAEYLKMDPTMIRLLWIILVLLTGLIPGIIAYIIACYLIPYKSKR